MTDKGSQETRNEIMVLLKPNSGVSLKSGVFYSSKPEQVAKVNRLLKENNSEVRKIEARFDQGKDEEISRLSEYHQIYYSGNAAKMLQTLKDEQWIESAYLKPKSEDPGSF